MSAQQPGPPGGLRGLSQRLPPTAFSFVMATGIVGNASALLEVPFAPWALFGINVVAYAVLVVLLGARAVLHWNELVSDLESHARGPGLLTSVAGTAVFGTQWLLVAQAPRVAGALWLLAAVLWLALTYALFARLTLAEQKPTIDVGLNGTWMLFVVGPQSIAVLGTLLTPSAPARAPAILGVSLVLHLLGCMFYVLLIALILYRFLFFRFDPERLNPPYWINMGAVAITTLAGSMLIVQAPWWPFLGEVLPFLKGFTLLFWSTATWWIPVLLILGVWRHGFRHVALRYDVQYWSIVFPVGMYSVATLRLSAALGWPSLAPWARAVGVGALGLWLLTTFGLCRGLPSLLRTK
jgi:tellurite resistance protein TehA-like permease